jgi:hypothetical protein
MTITPAQRTVIMKTWAKVCKDRGWKSSDRSLRLAKFSEILGRSIASADDIGRIDECTKLMNELKVLLGVSLQAATEADDLTINRARVLRNKILTELVPCLELYVDDVAGYITEIIEDKNRWWKLDRPTRGMTLMDLDAKPIFRRDRASGDLKEYPSPLDQMVYTLSACLNGSGRIYRGKKSRLGFRVAAGDTVHAMKIRAGVPCDCAKCTTPVADAPLALAELADEMQAKEEAEQAATPF